MYKLNLRIAITPLLAFLVWGIGSAQTKKPSPVVQMITEGVVMRESGIADAHGIDQPPWKQITIANVAFDKKPIIGDTVTVITLRSDISPFDLRISTAEQGEGCDAGSPGSWMVELEPVTQQTFFEVPSPPDRNAEYPFDVVVTYPAVKGVALLRNDQLQAATLPTGIALNTITAAIDLDDDRKPDLVIAQYCCGDTNKPVNECDYTCSKTFRKARNVWRVVETSGPC